MNNKPPLIIIAGATAVGKSELSVKLAKKISGEIISADSMQVYRGMDIGTAKISQEEMQGVKHYMIDVIEPDDEFNVFIFQKMVGAAITEIYSNGNIPIIAGGTGFYIQAVLYDIDFSSEDTNIEYRKSLENIAETADGPARLYNMLKESDPRSAEEIHPNNIKRIIRALEFYHDTGTQISLHNAAQRQKESPYDFIYVILNRDRAAIYDRINKRADKMIEDGLIDEVRGLLKRGVNKECLSMQGLGYKESIEYIEGRLSLDEAVCEIKKNTRHFAKRQITWFKREKEAVWMNYEDYDNIDDMVDAIIDNYCTNKIY